MISVIVTGNLTDDPHTFQTRNATTGCELRIAVNLPPRTSGGDPITRYFKVVTFGVLAIHTAASLRKGDRVTISGHYLTSEAWTGGGQAARPGPTSPSAPPTSRSPCATTPPPPAASSAPPNTPPRRWPRMPRRKPRPAFSRESP